MTMRTRCATLLFLVASFFVYTQHGCSAIFYAAKKGHKVVVEILIKSGANLNAEHEVKFIILQIKW